MRVLSGTVLFSPLWTWTPFQGLCYAQHLGSGRGRYLSVGRVWLRYIQMAYWEPAS